MEGTDVGATVAVGLVGVAVGEAGVSVIGAGNGVKGRGVLVDWPAQAVNMNTNKNGRVRFTVLLLFVLDFYRIGVNYILIINEVHVAG